MFPWRLFLRTLGPASVLNNEKAMWRRNGGPGVKLAISSQITKMGKCSDDLTIEDCSVKRGTEA